MSVDGSWPRERSFDLRPLDPVRSIKIKLGLVVFASLAVGLLVATVSLQLVGTGTWWALASAMTAALVLTQVLAHGMTSPLRQMTAAATAMAAGRPAPPVATSSRDEVGRLARAFTDMSAQLAAADAQRRALLADVAHELRTPVAALRAELENLVDGVRTRRPDRAGRRRSRRPSGWARWWRTCSTSPAPRAPPGSLDPAPVELGPLASDVARQVAGAHGAPPVVVFVSRADRVGRRAAAAPGAHQPARQRRPARQPRRPGGRGRPGRRRRRGGARGAGRRTRHPGRRAVTGVRAVPLRHVGQADAARATAAPAWGWPSPGGRSSCTAAGSRVVDAGPGCTVRVELPARPGRPPRERDRPAGRRRPAAAGPAAPPPPWCSAAPAVVAGAGRAGALGAARAPRWPGPAGRATLPGARAGLPLTLLLLDGGGGRRRPSRPRDRCRATSRLACRPSGWRWCPRCGRRPCSSSWPR